ncbi:hypothetical protein ACG98H_00705 [Corynebacterium sp. L4756]|uniref:hypothetical protein n=1 Tax=unclassified Corynebacterium TaxID=2624378 RepID=UPI00374CD824
MTTLQNSASAPTVASVDFVIDAQRFPQAHKRLEVAEKAVAALLADGTPITQSQLDWCSAELGRAFVEKSPVNAESTAGAEIFSSYPAIAALARANGEAHSRNKTTLKAELSRQVGTKDKDLISALAELEPTEAAIAEEPAKLPDVPRLELEPDTGKLYLILPAIMPSDDERIEWLIDAGFDSFRIPAETDDEGRPVAQRVNIVQPTAKITVTNSETGVKHRLPVIDPSFPSMLFAPDLSRAADQNRITHSTALFLAPTGTKFHLPADVVKDAPAAPLADAPLVEAPVATGADETSEASAASLESGDAGESTESAEAADLPTRTAVPSDEMKFSSWPEWSLFEFDNLDVTPVLLMSYGAPDSTSKASIVKQVRIGHTHGPRWIDAQGRIGDVQGVDGAPIYTRSPRLQLPTDDNSEWTVELYYIDTTAEAYEGGELPERELVEELIELNRFKGEPFPLFDDVFEDAWLGHYEIDVLRDGELVERRTYNLAEGFDLRVSYTGDSPAQFRHPDQSGDATAYTKAYFAQRSESKKYIEVPFERAQPIDRDERSKSFLISNPAEYQLDVVVVPKALAYSVDQRGEQPDWDYFPNAIALDSLSKNGEFRFFFPGTISGTASLLLTHEVSRKVKVIQLKRKRGGAVYTTTNASIRSAFKDAHASILATIAWHPKSMADTFAELEAAGKTKVYESELEFEKAYAAHTTPDVVMATTARFTQALPEIAGQIVGTTLRLSGLSIDKPLTGFLWPATRPDIEPWRVSFDARYSCDLPEELQDAGPIVLDVAETAPGYIAKAPKRPTFNAIVVDQPGHFDMADGAKLAWQLSKANEKETIEKQQQPALWRHLYALRNLDDPLLNPMRAVIRRTVNSDPRHMLEALGRSNVRVGDQPALTIYHGLANFDFHSNGERMVDFRATAWVYAIELLNELIDGNLDGEARADALDFIRTETGAFVEGLINGTLPANLPPKTADATSDILAPLRDTQQIMKEVVTAAQANALSDAVEALNDIAGDRGIVDAKALRHGWFELLRRRRKFEDIEGFVEFRQEMFEQEANMIGDDVRRHLVLLRKFGATYGQRQKNWWAWGPYLSVAAAHVSRAAAAEQKGVAKFFTPIKSQHLKAWADIAQLAPTLTTYYLVMEEARQLVRAHGPLA